MEANLRQLFDDFVSLANIQCLHWYDWNRFYVFIVACEKIGAETTPDEIEAMLIEARFRPEVASNMASAYEHGRRSVRVLPEAADVMSRRGMQR